MVTRKTRNDLIFRKIRIIPPNIITDKVICMNDVFDKGHIEGKRSKRKTKVLREVCNNQFTICSETAFSIKDDKCALGYPIFYKCVIQGLLHCNQSSRCEKNPLHPN